MHEIVGDVEKAVDRMGTLLDIRHLSIAITTDRAEYTVVNDVDLRIAAGEVVGLVGESGSGKSMTAMSVVRLLPRRAHIAGGSISLAGRDLAAMSEAQLSNVRGKQIGLILQDPSAALDPLMTIGQQLVEAILLHQDIDRSTAITKAVQCMNLTRIPNPKRVMSEYPHHLSGGMKQRAMIAMAICNDPLLLIADEPTTSLDVTIQQQIMELLLALRESLGIGLMLITHDLSIVAQYCDRVYVMYAGRIFESGMATQLFGAGTQLNPYTDALRTAMLDVREVRLPTPIGGEPPRPWALPSGCRFRPRCRYAFAKCAATEPPLLPLDPGHASRCWLVRDQAESPD